MKLAKAREAGINIIIELKQLPDPDRRRALVTELANIFFANPDRPMLEAWKERAGKSRIMSELRNEIEGQHAEDTTKAMAHNEKQGEADYAAHSVPPLDFVAKFKAKREAEERAVADAVTDDHFGWCECGHPASGHAFLAGAPSECLVDETGAGCECTNFAPPEVNS